ncbi:MAG: histidine kinase [Cytophagia bacterium]|nr:histidine kinase [Cytophagia bacterium]NBW35113.1 histidine kinase [Cytophagia bacterium]
MSYWKNKAWVLHLSFWGVIYIVYLAQQVFPGTDDAEPIKPLSFTIAAKALFHLAGVAATSYYICLGMLPLLQKRKKIIIGIVLLLLGLYLIAMVNRMVVIYVLEPCLGYGNRQETLSELISQFSILFDYYLISNMAGAFPFIIFYLLIDRQRIMRRQAEVEREKKEAELTALKSQINPHFLFNTLNGLYSLALQQSPKTPVVIEKLSHLLDYVLYRCTAQFVPLRNEIELIKNYIELEKIRFGKNLHVEELYYQDADYSIAPLLILSITENVFKHGVEEVNGITSLKVSLHAQQHIMRFETQNAFDSTAGEVQQGIGLKNLQQQLDLLYPRRYSLATKTNNNIFTTVLTLELQ